jgi:hypothetical protein
MAVGEEDIVRGHGQVGLVRKVKCVKVVAIVAKGLEKAIC